MNKDYVLEKLKEAKTELRSRGVLHAALFGSVARGEARPGSDIDIMIEIAPEAEPGLDLFAYVGIVHHRGPVPGPRGCGGSQAA